MTHKETIKLKYAVREKWYLCELYYEHQRQNPEPNY